MEKKNKKKWISRIFIIIVLIVAFFFYRKFDFNYYSKGIMERGKTSFSRDSKVTTNGKRSYKIENSDYNDSMFYRKISVKRNTPYKVSCMVKTENVEQFENEQVAGAQIILKGTEEHSDVIAGTKDWTKLEFCFNSKAEDTVEIGFRLGGNFEKAKGVAWFSEIEIEEGFLSSDTTWDFACFIFKNVDVNIGSLNVKEVLTGQDIYDIENNMRHFKTSISQISANRMAAEYDIIEIDEPITTLTYDDANGYYVAEGDIYNLVKKYTKQKEYDHIFACFKLPDELELTGDSNVTNWVGLGNMEYCGKGFSNIKTMDLPSGYIYQYSVNFPEEVFVHEFLHTLERNSDEFGYTVPALHDSAKYGYREDSSSGLKKWYIDYMNKNIAYNGTYIGLPEEIYSYKPVQPSDFEYSNRLSLLNEPQNIIETIGSIVDRIKLLFDHEEKVFEIRGVSS